MAIETTYKDENFGIGDRVRVVQKIKDGEKFRLSSFEGIVLGIKGRGENKTFMVRRIGEGQIGIERIFPLSSPTLQKIEVVRKGKRGVRRAKIYYIRNKAKREIEEIYAKANNRETSKNNKIVPKTVKSTSHGISK